MRPFRFRAAAALEIRRKQEDQARIALQRAESALQTAHSGLRAAMDAESDAKDALCAAQSAGTPAYLIGWHRSWIVNRQSEVEVQRLNVAKAGALVARETAILRDAHRKRRTLERLRDRSWRKYQVEAARQDVRDMNDLAGLRYIARLAEDGEQSRDHRQHDDDGQPRVDDDHQQGQRPARS